MDLGEAEDTAPNDGADRTPEADSAEDTETESQNILLGPTRGGDRPPRDGEEEAQEAQVVLLRQAQAQDVQALPAARCLTRPVRSSTPAPGRHGPLVRGSTAAVGIGDRFRTLGNMRRLALTTTLLVASVPAVAQDTASPPERHELRVPDDVWGEVLTTVGRPDGRLGYTTVEMGNYGGDLHLLDTVLRLFEDVRRLPRETGRWSDGMLANADQPHELVRRLFRTVDVSTGRRLAVAERDWDTLPPELEGPQPPSFDALPAAVRRLIGRLVHGTHEAERWARLALPRESLAWPAVEARHDGDDAYSLLTAPWTDEEHDLMATRRKAGLDAIAETDRAYLGFAGVLLARHVHEALVEFRAVPEAERTVPPDHPGVFLTTPLGLVRVFGPGDDEAEIRAGTVLTLDLGGDDVWTGNPGSSCLGKAVSLHVDLGGHDTYVGDTASVACGLLGLGMVFDESGDDRYTVVESGLGAAWHGVGLLVDREGRDEYRGGKWTQGAAHVGVAALVDLAGDDLYECDEQSQGLGSTLGAGLVLDLAGDDRYVARDDGNVSELYLGQSVAMSQGCGYGRRADLGDGHSLAGGVGLLVDGAGDDEYHAQVWAQGCGYWWGVGALEDRGGNDTYRNGKYSAGAAAHFALGVCADLAGDDRHNQGNDTAVNQYQGHARDGSVGVFLDGGGNDRYLHRNHCSGSADLSSIGLFVELGGDDHYEFVPRDLGKPNGWADTGPWGTATRYEPFHSYRDDLPAWGVFLDLGGTDTYSFPSDTPHIEVRADDGADWVHHAGPQSWGVGRDRE